ncbi:MAG: acyl-CoA dehydrogenase [Chloroflexi bacterium]|nr:MAG: acyl-CoA dehydrogenase [Chloroflexota bacterium]RLC76667.1 MAG: acyl-CoA dehydrogenase [Chloroflexota bacterium]HEY71647.1 acyl-CoA dehydrogenase [Thermoflexia bacterium]
MDFELTEEHRMIRRMVRDFAEKEIAPRAIEMDETDEFPDDLFRRMAELGIFGLPFPEKYGGSESGYTSLVIALEEIARVSGSMAITLDAQTSLYCEPVYLFGTEEQKRKYLTPAVRGEKIGCFGLTEPQAGSDAGATRTRAVRDGDEWVLNGQKIFITNGSVADFAVVTAMTDPEKGTRGISSFIVEKGTPGFQPGRDEDKMGLRGSVTSELLFENCRVPAENLVGAENEGFKQFLTTLDAGRVAIAAMAVGLAQGAFEKSVAYAQEREQFGRPIAKFQAMQWMIADMATEIEAARLLVNRAAWLREQGKRFTQEAAMAKLFSTEMSERVCHKAIQIHGGYGYMREYEVERMYRDQRLCQIGEGTNQIQRLIIARRVLGR